MAEVMIQLEALAYLVGQADSVKDRRAVDELLRSTETTVDAEEARTVCAA